MPFPKSHVCACAALRPALFPKQTFRLRAVTHYSTISVFTFQAMRSIFNLFKLTKIFRGSTFLYAKGTLMNLYENQPLTVAELRRLQALENRYRNAAREVFTNRVEYYHRLTGGHYTSITIRDQKTRWGSCSSRGTLSFNYRLIYGPAGPLDYVVVHELCHLTHMNHSKDFWNMVESIMPDYRIYKQWLRDHGCELTLEEHLRKQGIPIRLG